MDRFTDVGKLVHRVHIALDNDVGYKIIKDYNYTITIKREGYNHD